MSVTIGNVSQATSLASGSTISWNHTSNSNTIEIICGNADGGGGAVVSSVTVNGVTATILGQIQNSSFFSIAQALLTGVATSGTLAIVVTLATGVSAGIFASARSLIGVNQTTPTGATTTNFGIVDQAATVTAVSVNSDLVVGGVNIYSTTNSLTTGNSDWYATGGNLALISGRGINNVASGAATTIAATGGGGGQTKWVAIVTDFKAAAGGSVTGTGAITLGSMTIAGTGADTKKGTGAITLGSITTAGSGAITRKGTGAVPLQSVTMSGTAQRVIHDVGGPVNLVLGSILTAGSSAGIKTGSGAIALGSIAVAGSGKRIIPGTGAVLLKSITSAGAGTRMANGTGSILLSSLSIAGTGNRSGSGTGAISLKKMVLSGRAPNAFSYGVGGHGIGGSGVSGAGVSGPFVSAVTN